MAINFLKPWAGKVGELDVRQSVVPHMDGDELHVMTTFYGGAAFNCRGSLIPFAEAEKLADDGFRMELARLHLATSAKNLREAAEVAEQALAAGSA